jgi:hypothetical protein
MAMYAASSVAAKADTISLECEKASEGAGAAFMFVTMNLGNRTARMNENGIWYNYTISKLTDDRVAPTPQGPAARDQQAFLSPVKISEVFDWLWI